VTFSSGQRAIVVDASIAVEVLIANPVWMDRWTDWRVEQAMLLSPAHFHAEVANALLRSRGLPAIMVMTLLERLIASGSEIADRGVVGVLDAVTLAEKHSLTVYDALYLQLALDIDGELATLDAALRVAAASEGVAITS
jgi:predicted nucleic acid-binding protein